MTCHNCHVPVDLRLIRAVSRVFPGRRHRATALLWSRSPCSLSRSSVPVAASLSPSENFRNPHQARARSDEPGRNSFAHSAASFGCLCFVRY